MVLGAACKLYPCHLRFQDHDARQSFAAGDQKADPFPSDIHIYYCHSNKEQAKYARELWERIRRECKPG